MIVVPILFSSDGEGAIEKIKDVKEARSLPKDVSDEFWEYLEEHRIKPESEEQLVEEFNKWLEPKRKQEFAARWAADAAKLGYPDYRHGIVMDMADRNLLSAIQQENMSLETVRAMLRALVACVGHVHSRGRVHAGAVPCLSLCPLNSFSHSAKCVSFLQNAPPPRPPHRSETPQRRPLARRSVAAHRFRRRCGHGRARRQQVLERVGPARDDGRGRAWRGLSARQR